MERQKLGHQYDAELIELYLMARVALDNPSRYERLLWVARQFSRKHPEVRKITAYRATDEATRPCQPIVQE